MGTTLTFVNHPGQGAIFWMLSKRWIGYSTSRLQKSLLMINLDA